MDLSTQRRKFVITALVTAATVLTSCVPDQPSSAPGATTPPPAVPAAPPVTTTAAPEPPAYAPAAPPKDQRDFAGEKVTVTRVVDGDTVELADGRTIRLLGIDTPEVYGGQECWGPEASQFARKTLANKTVGLVTDPTQDAVDRYGRTLAYLVLPNGDNYSVLAAAAGAARAYTYDDPVQLASQIEAAEAQARAADRGLWGPPCNGAEQASQPPQPEPPDSGAAQCAPGYDPCVPPPPPDLDCDDVDGPIRVTGSDPHRLDGNNDGIGCE